MTTGAPVYLVSACTTGEEFVAAFRRYADRGSLFIPIAEPIPSGRRGRFAVTLIGGGVMVEGEGEVISSARTPSILHGRIGMTIRFAELDDPSKTVLIDLEKARLVAKPPAPSVAPRAAEVPVAPRPVPPTASARIDASSALAECVAIGDLEALASATAVPPKAGPRFVMPTVLPVGATRPKTPSTPPEMRPRSTSTPPPMRPKSPSLPPAMPSLAPLRSGPQAIPGGAPFPGSGPHALPGSGPHTLPPAGSHAQIMQAVTPNLTPTEMPVAVPTATAEMPAAAPAAPAAAPSTAPIPAVAPLLRTREDPTTPSPVRVAAAGRREDPTPPPHSRMTPPLPVRQAATPPPTPVVKPPIVAESPRKILINTPELDETTDLSAAPIDDAGTGRRTVLGVGVSPGDVPVLPAITTISDSTPEPIDEDIVTSMVSQPAEPRTELVAAQPDPEEPALIESKPLIEILEPAPPIVARAQPKPPTVEEPTPSGDWTITPGAAGPTISPRELAIKPPPPVRMTGDWTIQLDSDSPDGWTEPSKLDIKPIVVPEPEKPKPLPKPKAENPPELAAVARSIMIETQPEPPPQIVASEEPKVQVDPTLLEAPIVNLDLVDAAPQMMSSMETTRLPTPVPGTLSSIIPAMPSPFDMYPHMPTPIPGSIQRMATPLPGEVRIPTPVPGSVVMTPAGGVVSPSQLAALPTPPPGRMVTDGGVGFFKDTAEVANITGSFATGDSTSQIEGARRRRILVIAISAGFVVVIGILLLVLLGGKKSDDSAVTAPADAPAISSERAIVMTPVDAVEVATVDAKIVDVPVAKECFVEVTSVPPGAEVLRDTAVLGTTPAKVPLPCGDEVKLTIRKLRFASMIRPATATEEGSKLRVLLQKLMFSIKVSSQPAGASVSLNGKSVAVTPSTMKIPAFELATITFSKDGYAVESFKVTPKQNNQTVHAQLKKKPKAATR